MKLGVHLPTAVSGTDLAVWARAIEDAGFDSAWMSDHILLPVESESHYPFAQDGRVDWSMEGDWYDPMIQLAVVAAATRRIRLGTSVLVAPIRYPYLVARQFASLDRLFPARFLLGIGVGWLAEEFAAFQVDFARRGTLTDDWIRAVRTAWTGTVPAGVNASYPAPVPMHSRPVPSSEIPIVVGGTSARAYRRAGVLGDGWMGHESLPAFDASRVAKGAASVREASAGRRMTMILRLVKTSGAVSAAAELIPLLEGAGIDELIVDLPPHQDQLGAVAAALRGHD